MNNKIKELAQEVFSFKYKSNPNELNPDHNMDHIHKFAELIVRECVDIVASRPYIDDGNWSHPSTMIKKHFGVKE